MAYCASEQPGVSHLVDVAATRANQSSRNSEAKHDSDNRKRGGILREYAGK